MTERARSDGVPPVGVRPLIGTDPPRLGGVELLGRLDVGDSGIVYAGRLAGQPVAAALLTAGAERDSYARARFVDAVLDAAAAPADSGFLAAGGDSPEVAPWAAVRADDWDDGAKLAGALLAPVALEHLPPPAPARGPAFRPHWHAQSRAGRWRVWPLPWPARLGTAGRWTYVASFALVLAIASAALFVAVKLFENQPPAPVTPPFPAPSPVSPAPTPSPSPMPTPPPTGGHGPHHGTGHGGAPIV